MPAATPSSRDQANSTSESEDDDYGLGDVFPAERRSPSPPPTIAEYTRPNGSKISVQLVNSHPLWGHVLYPTAECLSDFLAEHASAYVTGRRVLELGAGGGLPSLVSALEGAEMTVVTDFPDPDLLQNLQRNVDVNIPEERRSATAVKGYTWGSRIDRLLESASLPTRPQSRCEQGNDLQAPARSFDTILAADLVFNHSQHLALLKTCEACLKGSEDPILLSFFAHHRPTPELIAKDEGFVKLAEERGWAAEQVMQNRKAGPAFPADGGDLEIRSTVHGWKLVPPRASDRGLDSA